MAGKRTSPDEGIGLLQRPVQELCCVNPACPDRGRRGYGNLSVRTGKGGGRWRILRCSTCGTEFSERKGTPLFGMTMAPEKIVSVSEHLKEGCGIRKTARLTGVSKTGVTNVGIRLGLHAKAVHDDRVCKLDIAEVQFDEKWAFVEKKQKNCDPADPEDDDKGDQWDHTAVDVKSRLVVSLAIGKRDGGTLEEVVSDFAERTGDSPPRPDHDRRLQHVRRGPDGAIRRAGRSSQDRQAGSASQALQAMARGVRLRDGQQDVQQGEGGSGRT
jgi:transposase-like protein